MQRCPRESHSWRLTGACGPGHFGAPGTLAGIMVRSPADVGGKNSIRQGCIVYPRCFGELDSPTIAVTGARQPWPSPPPVQHVSGIAAATSYECRMPPAHTPHPSDDDAPLDYLDGVSKAAGDCIPEFLGREVPAVPEVLFHYTGAEVPGKVLRTAELRLTQFEHLNDMREVAHFRDLALEALGPRLRAADRPIPGGSSVRFDHRAPVEAAITHALLRPAAMPFEPYLLSFSELDDDIQHWRSYAGDGAGTCIEVGTHQIAGLMDARRGGRTSRTTLLPVVYEENQKRQLLNSIVDSIGLWVQETIGAGLPSGGADSVILAASAQFQLLLLHGGLTCKHRGFRSEREWRIVVMKPTHAAGPIDAGRRAEYRSDPAEPRYVYLGISRQLVRRIHPGPLADTGAIAASIDGILGGGASALLCAPRSTIPYRRSASPKHDDDRP